MTLLKEILYENDRSDRSDKVEKALKLINDRGQKLFMAGYSGSIDEIYEIYEKSSTRDFQSNLIDHFQTQYADNWASDNDMEDEDQAISAMKEFKMFVRSILA